MLFVWIVALLFSFVLGDEACALQLQSAVFKPKFCGADYFEQLSCNLNSQLTRLNVDYFSPEVAQLCLRFASENQVQLSLLNAQGIDMCTLNNPTARLMALITSALNLRSSNDRRSIYVYYKTLYPGSPGVDIPPADSPDLDSIGIFYVYYYIPASTLLEPALTAPQYCHQVLDYINTYPVAGPQSNLDCRTST